jgi:hypothetical protein
VAILHGQIADARPATPGATRRSGSPSPTNESASRDYHGGSGPPFRSAAAVGN